MRKGVGAKIIREKMQASTYSLLWSMFPSCPKMFSFLPQAYVTALKTEFSSGLILPAKDGSDVKKPSVSTTKLTKNTSSGQTGGASTQVLFKITLL
jgi:hypothetical protein